MSLNCEIAKIAKITEEQLANYITQSTVEVFSTMIEDVRIAPDYPLKEPVTKFKCHITSMVGFAGSYSGTISLHCPNALAIQITSAMLGVPEAELSIDTDDVIDAMGEIANMLGGSIKLVLSKSGTDIKLSIPTVISGTEYAVEILSDVDCVVIPFHTGETRFLVGLTLRTKAGIPSFLKEG